MEKPGSVNVIAKKLTKLNHFLVTDLDGTLIGGENSHLKALLELLVRRREHLGFVVATGRTIESATARLKEFSVHAPDIIISSVGTEIYYGEDLSYCLDWDTRISTNWNRKKIVSLLEDMQFLIPQEDSNQSRFKVSYLMAPDKIRLGQINDRLMSNNCRYNLIYSHEKYLDILPYNVSKGTAISYLSSEWNIPPENILVCGDSDNDKAMLLNKMNSAVVGNYRPELESLRNYINIYFARNSYAGGILEAMQHYNFMEAKNSHYSVSDIR